MPRANPYADAPRLPATPGNERGPVDLRSLVAGAWLELEIGPGRGGFLFERAAAAPEAGLVGLEVRRKWAAIVDGRLAKAGLGGRARVFAEDAREALERLGPAGSARRVFVHFPDPWWKKRHQKRMVMGDRTVAEIGRLLERGGELYVQTDVEDRAERIASLVAAAPEVFEPSGDVAGDPHLAENPYGARSPREHRAVADGLPVHRLRWVRR
jgi:tRNA (guanine-N7-)-methyltransferase